MENRKTDKRVYMQPEVETILLDNEISLALESDAPVGPGEGMLITPEHFNNEPFRNSVC